MNKTWCYLNKIDKPEPKTVKVPFPGALYKSSDGRHLWQMQDLSLIYPGQEIPIPGFGFVVVDSIYEHGLIIISN